MYTTLPSSSRPGGRSNALAIEKTAAGDAPAQGAVWNDQGGVRAET